MEMVQSFRQSQNLANDVAGEHSAGNKPCPVMVARTGAKSLRNGVDDAFYSEAFLQAWFSCLQEAEQSRGGETRAQTLGRELHRTTSV